MVAVDCGIKHNIIRLLVKVREKKESGCQKEISFLVECASFLVYRLGDDVFMMLPQMTLSA